MKACDCANIQHNQCGCMPVANPNCNCAALQEQHANCGCGPLNYDVITMPFFLFVILSE